MAESVPLRGGRVKQARRFRGMSQLYVAELTGISQSNLSFIEANRHNTTFDTVCKLADLLEVSTDWLQGKSNEGGIPEKDVEVLSKTEQYEISRRFIECYDRLRAMEIVESDASFADYAKIPRSSLSLALSGKNNVPVAWIPFLEEKGADGEYIMTGKGPMLNRLRPVRPKNTDEIIENVRRLATSIEEDMKLLKSYINQLF